MYIEIYTENYRKFPFKKMIGYMLSLVKKEELIGINRIVIRDAVPEMIKTNEILQSCYYQDQISKTNHIELYMENIVHRSIPDYAILKYHEIGGLFLSEFIFHEIGHHVHYSKRHRIKKKEYEIFADKYAKAGYFKYFKFRASKILFSYKLASMDIFSFSKQARKKFSNARQDLVDNILNNTENIEFP